MRRSFGSGGSGRMGGGGGGGGIMRSVHRAVRAGGISGGSFQESFSCSTNNNVVKQTKSRECNNNSVVTLSSSNSSKNSSPFTSPPRYRSGGSRSFIEETDWECVYGNEDKRGGDCNAWFDSFGSVPSVDEVQHAVSALQKVSFNSNDEEQKNYGLTDLDWIEPPSVHPCSSMALRPYGIDRVGDALDLLQTDPSVQKMVMSISSDEAIWNAVLNNEAVREFRDSMNEDADKSLCESSDNGSDNSNAAKDIARWVVNHIRGKINQLVEKIMMVFHEVFQSSEKTNEEEEHPFEGKLRTSFFLSLVVMLMVVVTRSHGA
ncbi:hypothetical protein LIER_30100 [Lithospermum erythrorhizon]|uniref:Uncharacterized protein n=1 Tax=Lithospermum erythrorhizon TaxID=34254 RepID=A0AAV3RNB8_LITER